MRYQRTIFAQNSQNTTVASCRYIRKWLIMKIINCKEKWLKLKNTLQITDIITDIITGNKLETIENYSTTYRLQSILISIKSINCAGN